MNRESVARKIALDPDLTAILPELVFFRPVEEVETLIELFDGFPDNPFSDLYPIAKELVRPSTKIYGEYAEEFKEATMDQFIELQESGIQPMDIVYHYLSYKVPVKEFPLGSNTRLAQWTEVQEDVLSYINQNLKEFGLSRPLSEIKEDKVEAFMKGYNERLAVFLESMKEAEKEQKSLSSIDVALKDVERSILKSFLVFKCAEGKDVLEYFNDTQVSHSIPYVSLSPYSKVEQNAKVYPEWNTVNQESLIGYVRSGETENVRSYSQFEITASTLTIESRKKDIELEDPARDLIEKIQKAIPIQVEEKISEELSVETFFPNMDLHPLLFKHFITTDKIMRKFYFMDEANLLERKKEFLTLYYHANREDPPTVISIGNRKAGEKATEKLSSGRCHIRVYIRRCTRNRLEPILEDLARCVQQFQLSRNQLHTELKRFSPEIDLEYKKSCSIDEKKEETELNYNTVIGQKAIIRSISNKPRLLESIDPTKYFIINPEDGNQPRVADSDSPHALIFPSRKHQDQLNPYGYTCEDQKDHPFIGLSVMKSMPQYGIPYVPNCFKTDQYASKTSKLNLYLSDEVESESSSSYIITTSRVLKRNQFGSMMDPMVKWFNLVQPSKTLYRHGLFNFFIEKTETYIPKELRHASILLLLERIVNKEKESNFEELVVQSKAKLIDYLRSHNNHLTQTYNYSLDDLQEILASNQYIDPRLFYQALRGVYQTELLFLTKDEPLNRSIFYPCSAYCHTPMADTLLYEKFICVVINPGGEFDGLDFPLCEPVFFSDDKPGKDYKPKYRYSTDKTFYKAFNSVLKDLYGISMRSHGFSQSPTAQTLDSFGRVQWLHFDTVSAKVLNPVHSMDLPIHKPEEFINQESQVIQFLSRQPGFQKSYTYDSLNRKTGITAITTGYSYFFPIQQFQKDERYERYQRYEKISRYITEYTYLAYSLFARDALTFKDFANQCFLILPTHEYPLTSRYWKERDENYIRDGRVIVKSETMKTKLMYLLRQKFRANRDLLLSYQAFDYMPNYYASISDFTPQSQTILLDRISQKKSMEEEGSKVVKKSDTPYILYHELNELQHNVWICQPADSLEHALWICDHWRNYGSNPPNKGTLNVPHAKVIWSSETTYSLELQQESDLSHIVSILPLDSGVIYQALLPYRIM